MVWRDDAGQTIPAGAVGQLRASAYPPLTDQVGALVKMVLALQEGAEPPADALAVLDAVIAVKDAIPKPPPPPWLRPTEG